MDPSQRIDGILDVRLRDGLVAELGEHLLPAPGEEIVRAENAYVAPGFIDMHVHLREPGNPEKETIESGLAAAAAGGFTAVAAMPNTNPAIDSAERILALLEAAERAGLSRVYPIAAITAGRAGTVPVDYAALVRAGATAFSDDGSTIESAIVQTGAALRAQPTGRTFITHCEDRRLKDADEFDPRAEVSIVERDIAIAEATGAPFHIAHLSTAGAANAVKEAKSRGSAVTAEVTPHHLCFSREEVLARSAIAHVHPPLRRPLDVRALQEAVRSGVIDAFASDHAPHADDRSPGFSGLEIAAGAYAYAIPDLPVARYVEMLSPNPARILRASGGTLAIGSRADVTIFADREWTVEARSFYSKGKRTPFAGMKFPRKALATIVGGALVMQDGRLLAGTLR